MKQKILLCHLELSNKKLLVDEFLIYQIFKRHVIVKNIKVFGGNGLVKAFVLVDDEISQQTAITELHDTELNIGRIMVFQSHKQYISFERSLKDIIQEHYDKEADQLYNINKENEEVKSIDFMVSRKRKSSWYENSLRDSEEHGEEDSLEDVKEKRPEKYSNYWDHRKLNPEIALKGADIEELKVKRTSETTNGNAFYGQEELFKDSKTKKEGKSNMLKINGVNLKRVNFIAILNFFGCFGNISKLLTNFKDNYSIIEFETIDQAAKAAKVTHNAIFFGNSITNEFFYSKDIFDESQAKPKPYIKTRVNRPKFFRYKKNLKIKVNKPTRLLHFTNLPSSMTAVTLFNIVEEIEEPINIYKLKKKGVCSDMFLVEFDGIEKSIEVLSILHNKKVDGKLIKVSFSHTKVEM